MRVHLPDSVVTAREDVEDMLEAAGALERALDLDHGALVRELTGLLNKRLRFETLRQHFDHRITGQPPNN